MAIGITTPELPAATTPLSGATDLMNVFQNGRLRKVSVSDVVGGGSSQNVLDLAAITFAQGDILYFDGVNLVNLAPGISGQVLQTQGAGADPLWAASGGAGDMTVAVYDPAAITEQLVGLTAIQTLINKTLTSPAIATPTGIIGTDIGNTPAGSIAAIDVQAAINELDTEKQIQDVLLDDIAALTPVQGEIFYHNGVNIVTLGVGVSGEFLQTLGAGADPMWATPAGGGGGVSLISQQLFIASGTWTRPAGITQVAVVVVGAGGGGGGAEASAGGGGTRVTSAGGGAGSGSTTEIIDVSATPSVVITVGVGGAGGTAVGGDGATGGTSSYGAFASATGGTGGTGTGAAAVDGSVFPGGSPAGAGSGGDVDYIGNTGAEGHATAGLIAHGGKGSPSSIGTGAGSGGDLISSPTVGAQGGGGGGAADQGGVGVVGAAGGTGLIVVYEYG